MARWLLKEEPDHYSWRDLERDGATEWDGVHNALALRHLRTMRPGDEAFFYHTGDERACVGIVRVAAEPHPDPADDRGSWSVRVTPARALPRAVSLSEIRGDPTFTGFALLRISRLSVLPVPDAMWERILVRSASPEPAASPTGGTKGPSRGVARPRRGTSARRTRSPPSRRAGGSRGRAKGSPRGTGR